MAITPAAHAYICTRFIAMIGLSGDAINMVSGYKLFRTVVETTC